MALKYRFLETEFYNKKKRWFKIYFKDYKNAIIQSDSMKSVMANHILREGKKLHMILLQNKISRPSIIWMNEK